MAIPYLDKSSGAPSLPMNKPNPPSREAQLEKALTAILADPYGCVFCDSGKLRNPSKPHTPTCGFALARAIVPVQPLT